MSCWRSFVVDVGMHRGSVMSRFVVTSGGVLSEWLYGDLGLSEACCLNESKIDIL